MAYVAVLGEKQEDLLTMAERRWASIAASRPDLVPALALQRRLLTRIAELAGRLEHDRLPRLSLPARYLAAKLGRGVPALAGEPIPMPIAVLSSALPDFCNALAEGGAGDTALHIRDAVAGGDIDAGSLLAASLSRNQAAIRMGATQRGLSPDLVWLVAELAAGPFANVLQRALLENTRDETLRSALASWSRGYCPACGSWPALAEVVASRRVLRCSFCSSAWAPPIRACLYCSAAGEKFTTIAPDEGRADRRLEACGACGGYLKMLELEGLSPFPLVAISDIETTDLDVAAMEGGYARPALRTT
jgi:FdhE protein